MTENEESQFLLNQNQEKDHQNGVTKSSVRGGWYPWLVVVCSFLCVCLLDGVGYSFGVLFDPLLKELSDGHGRGLLAIAGSLQVRNN